MGDSILSNNKEDNPGMFKFSIEHVNKRGQRKMYEWESHEYDEIEIGYALFRALIAVLSYNSALLVLAWALEPLGDRLAILDGLDSTTEENAHIQELFDAASTVIAKHMKAKGERSGM